MDLLRTPVSEYDKQTTGVRFTVRSANSPSYTLPRRQGLRRVRAISEDEKQCPEDREDKETPREYASADAANKEDNSVSGCQTWSGSRDTALYEQKDKPGNKVSASLSHNGTADKTLMERNWNCQPAFNGRGRTEWRRNNLANRSKSLDWRTGTRSPDRVSRPYTSALTSEQGGNISKLGGRRAEGAVGRDMPNALPSHLTENLDWQSKGHSLPFRFRTQSGQETETLLGPKGGQSIMERIERLYGSAGFSKTDDYSLPDGYCGEGKGQSASLCRKSSAPDFNNVQRFSGGTFPRRFSSGEKGSTSPVKSMKSFTWTLEKDASTSGSGSSSLTGSGKDRISEVKWQDQLQSHHSHERRRGFIETGTKSLDRTRSRNTIAARIRSERAAMGVEAPSESDPLPEKVPLTDPMRERGGTKELGGANHIGERGETSKRNGSESGTMPDDVFEVIPQSLRSKTLGKKAEKISVRNKINQFEALTQRSQSLTAPRRAFSVPMQLDRTHGGVKKSGSARAIGDRWDDRKLEGIVAEEEKSGSERSFSLSEVGLRIGSEDLDERKEKGTDGREKSDDCSTLKQTLEIPINGGGQPRRRVFYIDETDFSKPTSPEGPPEKTLTANKSKSLSDEDKTPTNTPSHSPLLSPVGAPAHPSTGASSSTPSRPPFHPLVASSRRNLPDLVISEDTTDSGKGTKDLDAWLASSNSKGNFWVDKDDDAYDDDDDESTQKDDDSNYDSDSGESSVTVTSNMSQSDRRSFCVSLSDLCNFAGVESESENDSEECRPFGRRTASLSSDVSALSYVSVLPTEELDRLMDDVKGLGDNSLQDDVQVVVLHKEIGVGLGFSLAGGVDQSKPITVHKVFHSGVAAQEGSIREGDHVLSINGTALRGHAHWEALRVLRRAKTREMGVVVLRRGDFDDIFCGGIQKNTQGATPTQSTETGQRVCVCLEKNNRDLGFSLEGGAGLENKPLAVQKIFLGGPVDKVCPGDEVVEINGVSMVGMRRLEAWILIRELPPGPVNVVLSRPLR